MTTLAKAPKILTSFSQVVLWLRHEVSKKINAALLGRTNNTGSVTLTASATTTTVTNPAVRSTSKIHLTPLTANAAAEAASLYVSTVSDGSFVITHQNLGTTDRDFDYTYWG